MRSDGCGVNIKTRRTQMATVEYEVAGVELAVLDADIAGCVSTYLHKWGRLDPQRAAILGRFYREVSLVVRELSGTPQAYFAHLERMAAKVLEALSRPEQRSGAVTARRRRASAGAGG